MIIPTIIFLLCNYSQFYHRFFSQWTCLHISFWDTWFFYQLTIIVILQIRNAKVHEGCQHDSLLRSERTRSITIEHRQWVITSAVFLRFSFHEHVRTLFHHHRTNTIGLIHVDEGVLVILHLGWVPFASEPMTTTSMTISSWTNRVAIQCRLRTTVNRPEKLNQLAPLRVSFAGYYSAVVK